MIKQLFLLVFILQMLIPFNIVKAQTPMTLSKMVINIWPEYDRPGVLVFYQITLGPQTNLPATMTIRIPKSAEKPFNVAMKDVDGRLDTLAWTMVSDGDWIKATFTTPVPEVQFEYYDSAITTSDKLHQYQYEWPGDFNIQSLALSVQQPLGADNFQIKPAIGSGVTNDDGLVEYRSIVGEVSADTPFSLQISYNKTGSGLSAPAQSVSPVDPITPSTLGWQTLNEVLPYILAGLGVSLIIASFFWYWRSGRTLTLAFRRKQSAPAPKDSETESTGIFCHRCGRKAVNGDVFCRSCGTKLRLE